MQWNGGEVVAIQADPVHQLNPLNDGTLRLAREAQKRGLITFFYEVCDLSFNQGQVIACGRFVELDDVYCIQKQSDTVRFDLSKTRFVLIRQDPPFNMAYITATYILDRLPSSVFVINPTQALRNVSEKTAVMHLSHVMPTLISANVQEILEFCKAYDDVVLKPLYSFGGQGVVRMHAQSDGFLNSLEIYLQSYSEPIMVQPYCAQVKDGEKRIVWLKDQWVGSFLKVPHPSDFRANTIHQSRIDSYVLTNDDRQQLEQLACYLKDSDIFFAGIDMIGPYINEVNITSVGAFMPFNKTNSVSLGHLFWDAVLKM